jgi:hypothetical protein
MVCGDLRVNLAQAFHMPFSVKLLRAVLALSSKRLRELIVLE